jgi:hypothetical protein
VPQLFFIAGWPTNPLRVDSSGFGFFNKGIVMSTSKRKNTARRTIGRPTALRLQQLEDRVTPSIPQHAPDPNSLEVYQWAIINDMRADPVAFADKLQSLYNGTGSGWGFTGNDLVWDDIRRVIKQYDVSLGGSGGEGPWRFSDTLDLLRSQPKLGPLALDAQLSQDAFGHVNWMISHAYGHSVSAKYENDPSQWEAADKGKGITGFAYHSLGSPGFRPDFVNLDPSVYYHRITTSTGGYTEYTGGWGEDIGNVGFSSSTQAAFNKDGNQALLYRRGALFDVIGYLIDWGNGAYTENGEFHPNDGHLRNLLSHDQGDLPEDGSYQAKPKNKKIANMNSIGIDFYLYDHNQPTNLSGTANDFASTHRLAYRGRPDGQGGIITLLMYRDSDGDGFFTPGEERRYNITINGQTPTFTLSPAGTTSLLVAQNGSYNIVFTDPATGRSGKGSVSVNNGNVAVTVIDTGTILKIISSSATQSVTGLNLTDTFGRTLTTSTPTALPSSGGTFTTHTTLRSGIADLFALTVPAGSTLMARTSLPVGSAAPVDTYLRLFDATGKQLAANDDGGGSFYSLLTRPFAQGGTYYLGVSGGWKHNLRPANRNRRPNFPGGRLCHNCRSRPATRNQPRVSAGWAGWRVVQPDFERIWTIRPVHVHSHYRRSAPWSQTSPDRGAEWNSDDRRGVHIHSHRDDRRRWYWQSHISHRCQTAATFGSLDRSPDCAAERVVAVGWSRGVADRCIAIRGQLGHRRNGSLLQRRRHAAADRRTVLRQPWRGPGRHRRLQWRWRGRRDRWHRAGRGLARPHPGRHGRP